jgi:hypothetical protein
LRLARKEWQAGTLPSGESERQIRKVVTDTILQEARHDEDGARREKGNDDTGNALRRGRIRSSEEGHMCPACIASTAVMVAGAGSTGGILAVCIGKFRNFFRANRRGLFQKTKDKKEK